MKGLLSKAEVLAADPGVRALVDRMAKRPAPLTPADIEEARAVLVLMGRGKTPAGKVNSERLRRIYADEVMKAFFLAARTGAQENQRHRPRRSTGEWLPDPRPSAKEKRQRWNRRHREKKMNYSAASSARFSDPAFRAKALAQLALAREKEMERRRAARRES